MTKEELGQLVISNQNSMYHVAKSILFQDEDCKDAIQEAIVKAFAKIHTIKNDDSAKNWLFRILINECYQIYNRKKVFSVFEENIESVYEDKMGDYSDLYAAIKRLKPKLRTSIVLHYIEGYSIRETAGILNTTESAVKKRLARARSILKIDLEGGYAT